MRFNIVTITCISLLVITVGIVRSATIPPSFETIVNDFINNEVLPRNNQPGLGITIVTTDGSYNLTRGYGLKDIAKNEDITDSTLFLIGSVSKSFAATLVVKVLNEKFPNDGEGVLDIPVAKLLPSFNFTLIDRARAESTSFRDLLSHRVCLQRDDSGMSLQAIKSIDEFVYRSRYIPAGCPFRSDLIYSNNMIALAGELIAQINGNSDYTELLEGFLKDMGMTSTRVVRLDEDYGKLDQLATPYYLKDGNLIKYDMRSINRAHTSGAAGYIMSNMADMSKYLRFHLNLGKVNGKQIVPEPVFKWLYKPSTLYAYFDYKSENLGVNEDFAYGLGLFIGFFEGTRMIHHGGYWAPYSSELSLFPDLNIAVFTSSSGPGTLRGISPYYLNVAMARILQRVTQGATSYAEIKQELRTISKQPRRKNVEQLGALKTEKCNNCITADLAKLPGVYGNPSQGEITITLKQNDPRGSLYFQHGLWLKAYIRQSSSGELLLELDSDVAIADMYSSGVDTLPDFHLNFVNDNNFYYSHSYFRFTRNLTLETLPAIPWTPGSCTGV